MTEVKEKTVDLSFINSSLKEIDIVTRHIFNIVNKYVFALKEEEIVVRTDEKYNYSPNLLRQSLKETTFFKRVGNKLTLERLYSYNLVDNTDTYENRFIKYLVKKLKTSLTYLGQTFKPLTINKLLGGNLNLDFYGNYTRLGLARQNLNFSQNVARIHRKINSLDQNLSLIMRTDFYKSIKDENFSSVILTNILTNDKDYNYCYRYNLKNTDFFLAVIKKLVSDIKTNMNVLTLPEITKDYEFSDLELLYDDFVINLESHNKTLTMTIKLGSITHYYYLTLLSNNLLPVLNIRGDVEAKVPLLFVDDYTNILKALAYKLENKSNNCPYCGSTLEGKICPNCGLIVDKTSVNKKRYLWLLNLINLPVGGE